MRRIECKDIAEARSILGHLDKAKMGPVKIVLEVMTSEDETGPDTFTTSESVKKTGLLLKEGAGLDVDEVNDDQE